jgi:hypothetical protein
VQQPHAANDREDHNGQNDWRAFERFEFHRTGLNEKPEQLKAALVFLKGFCPPSGTLRIQAGGRRDKSQMSQIDSIRSIHLVGGAGSQGNCLKLAERFG